MKNLLFFAGIILSISSCIKDEANLNFDPVQVSLITSTSVLASGNVRSDGEFQIVTLGICYDTSPNPTLFKDYVESSSTGSFEVTLNNLLPNTTYYLRIYANAFGKNTVETQYGDQIIFKTYSGPVVTDIDGNIYNIITIGNQTWLKENLKVTHYNNGDPIENVVDITQWNNFTSGAYCNYRNSNSYASAFGRLYNWYAVNENRGLAPKGWHVATNHDWIELDSFLGGINTGGQLKETGTVHWQTPNTGATNSSGFTALPGGGCYKGQGFMNTGSTGTWWTSSNTFDGFAYFASINYDKSLLERTFAPVSSGFSVRCVKD